MTAHSHVRVQFRCLGNHTALILKPYQKQTYLFRARSFIAIQGVLLVIKRYPIEETGAVRMQVFPTRRCAAVNTRFFNNKRVAFKQK